jgi:MraZ protein
VEENGQTADLFLHEYDHTLDSKGRVSIPSPYRRLIEERGIKAFFAMNVTDGDEICIRVFPAGYFRESLLSSLRSEERRAGGAINAKARRELARKCTKLTLDKQGRITLTPRMCKRAKIDKDVRFVGGFDYFEIWGIEQFKRVHGDDEEEW